MSALQNYIESVKLNIEKKNSKKLKKLLTINPGPDKAEERKNFPEPSEYDLYNLDKFAPVVQHYLRAVKSAYIARSHITCFENLNQECISLIRASEQQDNWIMPVIINCFEELILLYKIIEQRDPEDLNSIVFENEAEEGSGFAPTKTSRLQQLINTLMIGFNLSNNDKKLDVKLSKRNDVYFFLANLIRCYFKMGKLALVKSAINSLKSGNKPLPNMTQNVSTCKNAITYLYYQSLVSLDDGNYLESEESLNLAMSLIANHKDKSSHQLEQILLILIPLKLYNRGEVPSSSVWQRFPRLKTMYCDNFLDAICHGNLNKFEQCMNKYEVVLLKNHLYILMELLRQYAQLRILNKSFTIISELQSGETTTPISAFKLALEFSCFYNENDADFKLDVSSRQIPDLEVETIIANLITQGFIRGYVSNTNRVVVFSKSLPFPKVIEAKADGNN
ncbi:CSN12 [Candida margitis]|uniref:CSN12 n=1 Tax=Candida margitis TaxID=1775924 RepID=UPI0022267DA6|nr:CSN12 [Candida margitis]KAI5967189.1 CSN12 [Candida margitis]